MFNNCVFKIFTSKGKLITVTEKVLGAFDRTNYYLSGLSLNLQPSVVFDIVVVAIIFYWVYLFLRETRAIRILYGFLLLIIMMFIAKIFNLILLNFILRYLTTALVVAIPIVFQPELRQALEKLGRSRFFSELPLTKDSLTILIDQLCQAARELSSSKIGALIVIQRRSGLNEYIDNGVSIDAKASSSILSSIFYPKSPLHDGAVIIVGDRIVSASSILPVAEVENSRNMGTRHRAAIGVGQISDAVAVVVSEETGSISIALGGEIERRITIDRLKQRLQRLLRSNVKESNSTFFSWFRRKNKSEQR